MKNYSKVIMALLGFALIFGLAVVPAAAKVDQVGDGIYLISKNPSTWEEIQGENLATVTYTNKGSDTLFTVTAEPLTTYALISYAEPYPGTGSNVIRIVTTDETGAADFKVGGLDKKLVFNTYADDVIGAKLWMVPVGDITINEDGTCQFVAWNPTTYLFEKELIPQP